jgi:hypothetical protein
LLLVLFVADNVCTHACVLQSYSRVLTIGFLGPAAANGDCRETVVHGYMHSGGRLTPMETLLDQL